MRCGHRLPRRLIRWTGFIVIDSIVISSAVGPISASKEWLFGLVPGANLDRANQDHHRPQSECFLLTGSRVLNYCARDIDAIPRLNSPEPARPCTLAESSQSLNSEVFFVIVCVTQITAHLRSLRRAIS